MRVEVRSGGQPVAGAEVVIGGGTHLTDEHGTLSLTVAPGRHEITVVKDGFVPVTSVIEVTAGRTQPVLVTLEPSPTHEEEVIVSATRTNKRVEDQPMRVEVVSGEEVQEKIMMTPGDVSMLLNETNGLRVQTTSPSLGGANVRIQGLRGRYTQILADGLPLYGGQTGSIGLLQIPPMDLGQVEVIKGVASALYGMSAIGGVVNLVSRRPPANGREAEVLVNRTSHAGADVVSWLAAPLGRRWGYTFVGGGHFQERSDLDEDGWTDLPFYRRVAVRPRLFWDDGRGKSLLVAAGGMAEERRGGTMPGAGGPDGQPFAEDLDTRRFDGGAVARTTAKGVVFAIRASATAQNHTHTFGDALERDRHRTLFGEVSATGTAKGHTWVVGTALQRERYRSADVPRFDYVHTIPGAFAQDEFTAARWLTLSASARIDRHSAFGTFVSPRVSLLARPGAAWTVRVSGGRGYFAPTPFTEETEGTGLSRVIVDLGTLRAERATSVSADLTWARAPLEVTGTIFQSRIAGALSVRDTGLTAFPVAIVNADGPTRTRGSEFIARYHREGFDVILTHMYLWSSEPDPDGPGRREIPLNPRHAASFDLLRAIGPARVGFEVFYTGRQALEDNPYRTRGFPHVLFGGLVDWGLGRARIFLNVENLGDVRQTREHPLVRPIRDADGRWTVDAWAPLEGRTFNGGIRVRF